MSVLLNPFRFGASDPIPFALNRILAEYRYEYANEAGGGIPSIYGLPNHSISGKFTDTCFGNLQGVDGCLVFDGNGTNFLAGDFTVEGWFYASAEPSAQCCLISKMGPSSFRSWLFQYDPASNQFFYRHYLDGVNVATGSASFDCDTDGISVASVFNSAWHHFAISRNGATIRCFIDGVLGANTMSVGTDSIDDNTIHGGMIGADYNSAGGGPIRSFPGFLSEVRVTKGVGRYTAAFTPPSAAFGRNLTDDSDFASVTLLASLGPRSDGQYWNHRDWASGLQLSGVLSGAQDKDSFGLRTSAQYAYNSAFNLLGQDFTFEVFGLRPRGSATQHYAGCWSGASNFGYRIAQTGTTTLSFQYSTNGTTITTVDFSTSINTTSGVYDVAVVREGGNLYLYLDGTRVVSTTISGSIRDMSIASVRFGLFRNSANGEVAGTKALTAVRLAAGSGAARYTGASYSIPGFPLPKS